MWAGILSAFISPIIGDADEDPAARPENTGKHRQERSGIRNVLQGFKGSDEINGTIRHIIQCLG